MLQNHFPWRARWFNRAHEVVSRGPSFVRQLLMLLSQFCLKVLTISQLNSWKRPLGAGFLTKNIEINFIQSLKLSPRKRSWVTEHKIPVNGRVITIEKGRHFRKPPGCFIFSKSHWLQNEWELDSVNINFLYIHATIHSFIHSVHSISYSDILDHCYNSFPYKVLIKPSWIII